MRQRRSFPPETAKSRRRVWRRPAPLIPTAGGFRPAASSRNADGRMRTVGVEIEFAGPDRRRRSRGRCGARSADRRRGRPHAFRRQGLRARRHRVELDIRFLHPEKKAELARRVMPRSPPGSVPPRLVVSPASSSRRRSRSTGCTRSTGPSRSCASVGRQGHAGRGPLRIRAALQPGDPPPRRGDRRRLLKSFVLLNAWLRRQVAPDTTRHLLGFADPFPPTMSAGSSRPTTGRTFRPSSTTTSPRTPPATATSTSCRCLLHLDEDARPGRAAEREDQRPADLPLPPSRRAGERSRLEHRARLEPLGRRRAAGRRPRAARRRRRRLSGLRGRGEELGRHRRTDRAS